MEEIKILMSSSDKVDRMYKYLSKKFWSIPVGLSDRCYVFLVSNSKLLYVGTEYFVGDKICAVDIECYIDNKGYFDALFMDIDKQKSIRVIDFDEFI